MGGILQDGFVDDDHPLADHFDSLRFWKAMIPVAHALRPAHILKHLLHEYSMWLGVESVLVALSTIEVVARCEFFGIIDALAGNPYCIEIALESSSLL
ncbi:hypothetical protein EV714DRAFT_277774 [Schizophyllum commune]